ncbi:MAG: poly-gamma-glutamate system protein [Calditrichota bacterium]
MLYRPSLRSIWTLLILAAVCAGLYTWCEESHVVKKMPYYREKIAAAELMEKCLKTFQESTSERGVFSENYEEPLLDALIGQQFSLITTEIGNYESKLAGANPNFAALVVDFLKRAGVGKGDLVAVAFTGSNPGVNTAVLCACEIIGATPITITAIGASWWGANDPEFTWADMEGLLIRKGLIHSRPVAGSLGGMGDAAVGTSQVGRDLMKAAIERNGLIFIQEDNVPAAVARWYRVFQEAAQGQPYKAYVNVGTGIASLGHRENAKLIFDGYHRRLPVQNYPSRGVIHRFNADGVSLINLYDMTGVSKDYGLGAPRIPLPAIGQGDVYEAERYDLRVAGVSAFIALLLIIVLVRLDSRLFKLREAGVDPDTLM